MTDQDDEKPFTTDGDVRLRKLDYSTPEHMAYTGSYVDGMGLCIHPKYIWDNIPLSGLENEIMPEGCDAYIGPRGWLIRERLVLDLHTIIHELGIDVYERFKEKMCGSLGCAFEDAELDAARYIYTILVESKVPSSIIWLVASGNDYV